MQILDRTERFTFLGKDKAGRPITLSGGFLKRYNQVKPESSPAVFHFNLALLGAHFPDENGAKFTELSTPVPALGPWLGISGFTMDVLRRRELTVHFSKPEDVEFDLEPGLKGVFAFASQGPILRNPQLEVSLSQEVWLILRASPAWSFGELAEVFHRILNLLSLLIGEALGYESLLAEIPHMGRRARGDKPSRIEILFSPIAPELVDKVVEGHRMLLCFQDALHAHPDLFQRWLERYKVCRPAFDIYFSLQRRDPGHQEQRFLGTVQSLETLHRLTKPVAVTERSRERLERIKRLVLPRDWKWLEGKLRYSHEPSLSERIGDLLQPFGDLFSHREERRRFANKTADTRNYLTHYDPALESKAVEPSGLTPYLYRLKVLFVLCCLLELGFAPDEARQLVEKDDRMRQMVRFGKI